LANYCDDVDFSMIYVEDVFVRLASAWSPLAFDRALSTAWDVNFINSMAEQIGAGRALFAPQAEIVLMMIGKVGQHLVAAGDISATTLAEVLYGSRKILKDVIMGVPVCP